MLAALPSIMRRRTDLISSLSASLMQFSSPSICFVFAKRAHVFPPRVLKKKKKKKRNKEEKGKKKHNRPASADKVLEVHSSGLTDSRLCGWVVQESQQKPSKARGGFLGLQELFSFLFQRQQNDGNKEQTSERIRRRRGRRRNNKEHLVRKREKKKKKEKKKRRSKPERIWSAMPPKVWER